MSYVKAITGEGITDQVGMVSADLGIPRWDSKRGCNVVMFGDNFSERYLRGEWQSPSIVCYNDDYDVLGIPTITGIASEGNRRQIIPYEHGNAEFSTILPCDFIRVAGIWYVAAMVTQGLGNELRTVFWQSRNLVDWAKTEPYVSLKHPGHPGSVMLTFDQIGDYVYIFGTGGLSRDRGVWLWRNQALAFPHGPWEPWGYRDGQWAWGVPNENTPVLDGQHGELCFRYLQGNSVLSYFDVDEYKQTALTVPDPTDDWNQANRCDYATGDDFPQLYGGYITPASQLNEPDGMEFLVSQWNTATNDPYHVVLFQDTLMAQGPLLVSPPPTPAAPEAPPPLMVLPPLVDVPKDATMTPQELYDLLLRELSASGSIKITTPEGEAITLRQAIEQIFYKERGLHGLEGGRPRHPNTKDDQLGQVLSTRAEGLFTQACAVAIADKMGIDTTKLYSQVRKSLS